MDNLIRILGIAGSLRRASYNRMALRAAVELAPHDVRVEPYDISDIPLYNEDVRQHGFPPPVQRLISAIESTDAVLFVTPEYNYSVPGVLKNAIDWVSRSKPTLNEKPVAIMGASTGLLGSARAQYHLRQIMVFVNAYAINRPEVMITCAADKFDDAGRLTDPVAAELITALLRELARWTRRLRTDSHQGATL